MAVTSTNRIAGPFAGNSATTLFPFTFKVFTAADLFVLLVDGEGNSSVMVLGTDFTAVLNGNQDTSPGGAVTLTNALETGTLMTITSSIAGLQEVILTNLGGYFPTVLNAVFDRLTILNQQVQQGVNQCLKFGLTDDLSSVELPPAALRAGTFLTFDENGHVAVAPLPLPVTTEGGSSTIPTVQLVDTVDGSLWNVFVKAGQLTVSQGAVPLNPQTALAFVDTADATSWNLTINAGQIAISR